MTYEHSMDVLNSINQEPPSFLLDSKLGGELMLLVGIGVLVALLIIIALLLRIITIITPPCKVA